LKQTQIDAGERDGLSSGEREELRRLRREVVRLREEREIGLLPVGGDVSGRVFQVDLAIFPGLGDLGRGAAGEA
jgi:hypothetical protein